MNRIRRVLRSALAWFRKPAAPAQTRREITTAEAWDLWREACCDERGGHYWQTVKHFEREHEYISFACGCCTATTDVFPVDDEIWLPWGVMVPVRTGTCEYCGTEFRFVTTNTQMQKTCSRAHARAANKARTRPERMAAQQAREQAAQEAARFRARLAACAEKNKKAYADERTAFSSAGKFERLHGERIWPYECPCGSWHLTSEPPDARQKADALKLALFGEDGARTAM